MTTRKALAPLQSLSRSIAPAYSAAAPEELRWAQEKEFFRVQLYRDWKVARAIEQGRPETIESAKQAARECAAMGLTMNPAAKLVYFIPRRARKKWNNESEKEYEERVPWLVYASPSYMGLAFIGTRYGGAEFFASEVVYKAELEGAKKPDDGFSPRFISYGPISAPVHRPVLDNAERVVGKAVGAYAVVVMKSGHVRFEYVDVPTIQRIRQLSDNPDSLMYTKLWTEGYRKIPIRRIAKLINTTEPRMLSAIDTLDRYEGITFEGDSAEVPHGTGEAASSSSAQASATREIVPAPSKRSTGLSDAMSRARARYDEAELVGDPPPDYAPGTEPEIVAPETEAENPHAFQAAPSRHPPGALEWFGDQLSAATSRERLEEIKIEALRRRVDTGEDANTFRAMYSQRARELREASAPRPDPEPGDLFGGVS